MSGRAWTYKEIERMAELRRRNFTWQEIADMLGRSKPSVEAQAFRAGLLRQKSILSECEAKVRELHAEGLSDASIGKRLGVPEGTVRHWRYQLGLKAGWTPVKSRVQALRLRRQLHAVGKRTLAEVEAEVRRARAAAAGWPPDTSPAEVAVLEVLERGPKTCRAVCLARGVGAGSHARGIVRRLFYRGLLRRERPRRKGGRGTVSYVYALAIQRHQTTRISSEDGPLPKCAEVREPVVHKLRRGA